MEAAFEMVLEELRSYDPAVVIAAFTGIAVFIVELILYSKGIIFSSGEKKLEQAKKKNHTVIAQRTHLNFEDRKNDAGHMERVWFAVYEYSFKGIHGKKTIISHHGMPGATLTPYHDGKSSKVYTDTEMRQHKRSILLLIIPLVVMLLVAKLLGYQP